MKCLNVLQIVNHQHRMFTVCPLCCLSKRDSFYFTNTTAIILNLILYVWSSIHLYFSKLSLYTFCKFEYTFIDKVLCGVAFPPLLQWNSIFSPSQNCYIRMISINVASESRCFNYTSPLAYLLGNAFLLATE